MSQARRSESSECQGSGRGGLRNFHESHSPPPPPQAARVGRAGGSLDPGSPVTQVEVPFLEGSWASRSGLFPERVRGGKGEGAGGPAWLCPLRGEHLGACGAAALPSWVLPASNSLDLVKWPPSPWAGDGHQTGRARDCRGRSPGPPSITALPRPGPITADSVGRPQPARSWGPLWTASP